MSKFKQRQVEWYIFDVSLKWRKQNWLKYFFNQLESALQPNLKDKGTITHKNDQQVLLLVW